MNGLKGDHHETICDHIMNERSPCQLLNSSHELSILPVQITGITDIKTSAIYLLFVMVNNNKQQQQTVPANVTNIHKQVGSVLYTSILSTG